MEKNTDILNAGSRVAQVACAGFLAFIAGCDSQSRNHTQNASSAPSQKIPAEELLVRGEDLYGNSCAVCHLSGELNGMNASLLESNVVKGPPEALVRVILHGQSGVSTVNGALLGGIMPGAEWLSDEEVAAVATYVRQTFGGTRDTVQTSLVAPLR